MYTVPTHTFTETLMKINKIIDLLSPQAIKNNASFRVWILFFLVMCSLSLLFLDWYS